MKSSFALGAASIVVLAGIAFAQEAAKPAEPAKPAHIMLTPTEMTWGAPPPVLKAGAQLAVVAGNPGATGPFTIRLKMPAGYKIAPHWHPTDEHVTVISGTLALGMGETFDAATMKSIPVGGYAVLPAEMRHYAMAKTAVVVQVHGMGPFVLTYVNPADDPSKATAPATK